MYTVPIGILVPRLRIRESAADLLGTNNQALSSQACIASHDTFGDVYYRALRKPLFNRPGCVLSNRGAATRGKIFI